MRAILFPVSCIEEDCASQFLCVKENLQANSPRIVAVERRFCIGEENDEQELGKKDKSYFVCGAFGRLRKNRRE